MGSWVGACSVRTLTHTHVHTCAHTNEGSDLGWPTPPSQNYQALSSVIALANSDEK